MGKITGFNRRRLWFMMRRIWLLSLVIVVIGVAIFAFQAMRNEGTDDTAIDEKPRDEDVSVDVDVGAVSLDAVKDITLWTDKGEERTADDAEKADIISWLNDVKDVRENKAKAGSTPIAGMIVHMESGDPILVLRSGDEFEIQQQGKSYWAREPHIRAFLDELAGGK
jgi:hypothetical protein